MAFLEWTPAIIKLDGQEVKGVRKVTIGIEPNQIKTVTLEISTRSIVMDPDGHVTIKSIENEE